MKTTKTMWKIFIAFIFSFLIMVAVTSCCQPNTSRYIITDGAGYTYSTDKYVEKDGCVNFTDINKTVYKICGTYKIEENQNSKK